MVPPVRSRATSARTGGAAVGQVPRRPAAPRAPSRPPAGSTPPPAATARGTFPLVGAYSFGGADARFGAGRAGHIHQGQDVVASSGTPIVAPLAGAILFSGDQPAGAGIYLVLHGDDARDYVFMHIRPHSLLVGIGDLVHAGQQLAQVGATGDATGPHLHFEIWIGGWGTKRGRPIDPLPQLKRWAAGS
jgi:murein DD-endopeptidase MepM/ murein hydrolase activator NlpD